jgi:hypothetical protein
MVTRALYYEKPFGVKGYPLLMNKASSPQEYTPSFRGVLYVEVTLRGVKRQVLLTPYETGLKHI